MLERARTVEPIKPFRPWHATVLLMICATWSFVDKHIFSLLIEPIKASLNISDSQIGMIHSVSFSLFMLLAMLPLARLADRGSRPRLIAWCIAFWSLMTMACGLATHWVHLLIARTGVAVGEAGLPPAALSYLADIHKPRHLPRANAIYLLGPFVGGGLAMLVGGSIYSMAWDLSGWPIIGGLERWQLLFMLVGAPGFLLAAAVALRLREVDEHHRTHRQAIPMRDVGNFLIRIRWFFLAYSFAIGMTHFVYNAHVVWLPTTLMRSFGLETGQAGILTGTIYLVAGISGIFSTAWLVGRGAAEHLLRRALRVMLTNAVLLLPLAVFAPVAPSLIITVILFFLSIFLTSGMFAVSTLPLQIIAPSAMRARTISIHSILVIVIGPGFGPLAVGVLSDLLNALSHALAIVALLAILSVIGLLSVARHALEKIPETDRGNSPDPA